MDQEAFEYFSSINLEKAGFNIYISSGNKIASCCRLINDLDLAGIDSFGNGGVSLGSHRVVTLQIWLVLALKDNRFEDVMIELKDILLQAKDILIAHQ